MIFYYQRKTGDYLSIRTTPMDRPDWRNRQSSPNIQDQYDAKAPVRSGDLNSVRNQRVSIYQLLECAHVPAKKVPLNWLRALRF